MGAAFLIVIGIAIHIVLLCAIFDLYFLSPITHGIAPVTNNVPTPCERVVFISIDGLRLDALLDQHNKIEEVTPFLNKKMTEWGAWGVSKCHLPTESRPGHVAMLAGFYEDPSAVTKGWKENPVDFDSLFNRSVCSFAWGSPDIVNIFYKGLKHSCAYKWTYDEQQDFAGNTMAYDNWVHDNVVSFFETAESPLMYSKSKSLFFLHLLGQDTSGHTHKPGTDRYRENLRNVDRIVRKIDSLFGKIFPGNKTSFVVSADHGMTNWGSHGAGDPSETLTPIVSWGCGIKKRQPSEQKFEIDQADITPLVAVLLGISIPVNSVGILPASFLNLSPLERAEANLLNAEQMAQQYVTKRSVVEAKTSLTIYKKYQALDAQLISDMKQAILQDIKQGLHGKANEKSRILIKLSLEGLWYYQNYFQTAVLIATTAIFIGWVLLLILTITGVEPTSKLSSSNMFIIALAGSVASYAVYNQGLPPSYHAYSVLPTLLIGILFLHWKMLRSIAANNLNIKRVVVSVTFLFGIELLVFGFFQRWSLGICMTVIVVWPLFQINLRKNYKLILLWALSGLSLAIFSLIPVIGKVPNPILPVSASVLIVAVLFTMSSSRNLSIIGNAFSAIRYLLILSAGLNNYLSHSSFLADSYLNSTNAAVSWTLLALSVPLIYEQSAVGILEKFRSSFGALSIPFLLLSISHEGFFLLALFIHMSCWVNLEMVNEDVVGTTVFYQLYTRKKLHDGVTSADFRRAYFFLAYIYIGFFGVGNLATLNSFDPAWVRCFLTTFSPFTMTALILLKVIIPFFVVSLALRALTLMLNIRPSNIFLIVLVYCNLMGINFLFLIRNEGSWLDIGTSLSHYVIKQVTIVFLLLLFSLSQVVIPMPEAPATSKFHSM